MTDTLPLLLPNNAIPRPSPVPHIEWVPKVYLEDPQPPPQEDNTKLSELQLANPQLLEGKILKKTRPRRTVDYNGGLGRWALLRKLRPSPTYVPQLRPCPPSIIDVFLPKAYPENPSTSLCTKFVHTSTNKIRCAVHVVVWTPESRRILTGSSSGEFTLWNGLTFNFETILQAHDNAICTMTFNHSGSYLASADKGGVIKYFEPNMNNLTAFAGSTSREAIRGLSFSPDDQRFATASDDSTVKVWSFGRREVERVLTGHGWDVKCVQWHPTKGLLVSGGKDNQMKFWDPRTGTALSTLHSHKNTIQALAWSPNGNMLASASRDQTARIFDIRAMKEFRILKGHKKEVCSISWHPVHPLLVTGGSEGSILHWDLSTPDDAAFSSSSHPTSPSSPGPPAATTTIAPRAVLSQAHDSNVWSLVFHPFGHILVSASNDYTTRFWSRERAGDVHSVWKADGEKPPEEMGDMGGGMDEEDEMMVPGLGYSGGGVPGLGGGGSAANGVGAASGGLPGLGTATGGGGWWGKEEESTGPSWGRGGPSMGGGTNGGGGGGGGRYNDYDDDAIPGFGSSAPDPRQNGTGGSGVGSYPRQDMYGTDDRDMRERERFRDRVPDRDMRERDGYPRDRDMRERDRGDVDEFGRDRSDFGGGPRDDWSRGSGGYNRGSRYGQRRGGGSRY